jgi:hypothetical protein
VIPPHLCIALASHSLAALLHLIIPFLCCIMLFFYVYNLLLDSISVRKYLLIELPSLQDGVVGAACLVEALHHLIR